MAGGSGTRMWPHSRRKSPKQALKLVGERTMIQHAVDRIVPLFGSQRIAVVTRDEHRAILAQQTPNLLPANFIIEPQGRGTAPAIGLGAIHLLKQDPDAVMAVLTADHFIADTDKFCKALETAHDVAQQGHLVTLGITPSFASTGFGYIKQGSAINGDSQFPVYAVERFIEKPDAATAAAMLKTGGYSWNSGMFIWRVDRILEEFKRQMPEFYAQLMEVAATIGTSDYEKTIAKVWPAVVKETIDYGIMEKATGVAVIPVDIGWTDVGSWSSLFELLPLDENGNAVTGPAITVDTKNTLLFGEKRLIAAIGLDGFIVVDTDDALLICPKEREQEVREVVKRLENGKQDAWL
jgi:mannose-1-phosphate guanylyltransferase